MKQILQNLSNGEISIVDIPIPQIKPGHLLIQTRASLISAGTERMLLNFGQAGLVSKARQQPDKVRMVLDKIKTDGLVATYEAVRTKLDQPLALGYCNSGIVINIGSGVKGFEIGDRVVSNGFHAEIVSVPKNLCAKIPGNVDDDSASFAIIGSIALQGIRLANPTMGEKFVVIGLGIIGLLTVQLLRAHGCNVLGIDLDEEKINIAKQFGVTTVNLSHGEDPIRLAKSFSLGQGVDGVLITASTKSSNPVHQAALMCRKRGRIILVGVTGLELSRQDFYEKELSFQVSCSYGPGRYDSNYEEKGHDYPIGYVRWTEQRNFQVVLDMLSSGQISVKPLISHIFNISQAQKAYEKLNDKSSLGIILNYKNEDDENLNLKSIELIPKSKNEFPSSIPVCAFLGAGNYASRILIPAFKKSGAILDTIVTSSGVKGVHYGKKFGFRLASTDFEEVKNNADINSVVIVTQHNTHASLAVKAINAGKNVFVEKPLAITNKELEEIKKSYNQSLTDGKNLRLMVGFNRRFAPHIIKIKKLLNSVKEPKSIIITVNAGEIPFDSWIHDPEIGGGRIIGEGCHFIDLMRHLTGSPITTFKIQRMGYVPGVPLTDDRVTILLDFADGSMGTIHYFANGGKRFQKERIEIFCNDAVIQLNNFRTLIGYGWKGFTKMNLFRQDKGQKACAKAFLDSIKNGFPSPIPFEELFEVSKISIELSEKLKEKY